jgi:branched-chain amino acid transport system substrate-binding protein
MSEPVVAGAGGTADVLVVSDLPLQGDLRLTSTQMAQAITFALREHGFRAGRLRIAYQSCDDALAGTGSFDAAKCAANGRGYARNADVIAVIGSFHSGCAEQLLPPLNRARGGPLGMISPLNSYVGLTRGAPEVDVPTQPSDYYPTGERSFVRVYPGDDLQSGALALLARDRGRRRVYVLDDGLSGYSVTLADGFEHAASKLGLEVVGRETWSSKARSYAGLAERVADSGAQGVYLSGLVHNNGGEVLRALRARLGDQVDMMAPDGFAPPALLIEAAGKEAARGVFLATNAQVAERLPPAGLAFMERFARTQPGVTVEVFAAYAAQATEALLAALARSDGTRASVVDELFRVRLPGSLLGDIAFDHRGDVIRPRVTVLRVTGGGGSFNIASAEGGVVERIYEPSTRLVERSPTG